MPELAREGLAVPVKRRLNATDAFSGCRQGFSVKLGGGLDHEVFSSLDGARPFTGSQMR
jgi:hypothetical protein